MTSFPATFEESRDTFRRGLSRIREFYPQAKADAWDLEGDPTLSQDWILAEPAHKDKLLILTSGLHGIEGYTGAAMQQLFLEQILPALDHQACGLLLVHAINPWGMKHRRKVNAANVDLNRNFTLSKEEHDPRSNPAARRMRTLLAPQRSFSAARGRRLAFFIQALGFFLHVGRRDFMAGALMGQYALPEAIFYGGEERQPETRQMMDLFQTVLPAYREALALDLHTGYGPRHQMSIVCSPLEDTASPDLAKRFNYPLVQKADADEFYAIQGDMVDYLYKVKRDLPRLESFFGCTLEFGTYGDSLLAGLRSLQTMVFEMQSRRRGVVDPASQAWISSRFNDLYDVQDARWRDKASQDFQRAMAGILWAGGYLRADR